LCGWSFPAIGTPTRGVIADQAGSEWIRLHTLNGFSDHDLGWNDWDKGYSFGSREKAWLRWMAAIRADVDFIATDQYEDMAALVRRRERREVRLSRCSVK
jgi:hypothetical protein